MDRGWFFRLGFLILCVVSGLGVLWPSVGGWFDSVKAPEWLSENFENRINLGLDIKGGLRLMYEVEVDEAIRDVRDQRADQLVDRLGVELGIMKVDDSPTEELLDKVRERASIETPGERDIVITFKKPEDVKAVTLDLVRGLGDLKQVGTEGNKVTLTIDEGRLEDLRDTAVSQARETISERIDKLGVKETSVTARGTDIAIEIPGQKEDDFKRIREIIAKTARLEFKIVDDGNKFLSTLSGLPDGITMQSELVSAGQSNPNATSYYLLADGEGARIKLQNYVDSIREKLPEGRDVLLARQEIAVDPGEEKKAQPWRTYLLHSRADVTGEDVQDAFTAFDQQDNRPYVSLNFNTAGAKKFERLTGRNIKRRMAVVLDDTVESAPVIQDKIGARCQITLGGMRSYNEIMKEAKDLVLVLRAGALPAPIRPSNEQLIGPTLGADAIAKGGRGALVGIVLVLLFVGSYYQVAGIVANVAVLLNLLFVFALLSLLGATLTLPGVAGIALTVGMAVDANVLINERIREELRAGKSPRSAVDQGYGRAFWSIMDSQLTTFIAGVVLLQYGTGPIKGFAVTLMIGIVTSLFTGIFCSRVLFDYVVRGLRVKTLKVG